MRSMRSGDDLQQYKAYSYVMARSTCRDCGEILTQDNRVMKSVSKKGKQYHLNRCKPCIVEADILLRNLKKQNPQPAAGTPCACCNRIDKLFCDHDHATGKFCSWICRNCNSGIGLLGDSEAGLKLKYLLRDPDQPLTFFNIQRYLKVHYPKVDDDSSAKKEGKTVKVKDVAKI